jgi:hypothetical protein
VQSEEGPEEEEELLAQVGSVSVVSLCRTFLLQQLLEVVVVAEAPCWKWPGSLKVALCLCPYP